jgi:hypothetical protein
MMHNYVRGQFDVFIFTLNEINSDQKHSFIGSALDFVVGRSSVRIPAGTLAILTEFLRGFPEYLESSTGIVPKLSHDHFRPCPFQFITRKSSQPSHSILYSTILTV